MSSLSHWVEKATFIKLVKELATGLSFSVAFNPGGLHSSNSKSLSEPNNFSSIFLAHLSTTCSSGAFRVVRCPSCVINNFFKHLLLPNRWANLDQTWQECSLGRPLQKLFTEFDSIKNSGCHGNKIEFLAHLSTTCSGGAIVTGHRPASVHLSVR